MGQMEKFKCDTCPIHNLDSDEWHMMNCGWVDGKTTNCKLKCFHDVGEEISGTGRKIKALSTEAILPKNVDGEVVMTKEKTHQTSYAPPMVRVGDLFVSVPYMGEDSWGTMVKELRKSDSRQIVVLSGIHGTQSGLEVDKNGYWTRVGVDIHGKPALKYGIISRKHIKDDQELANKLGVSGVSVEEVYSYKNVDHLKGVAYGGRVYNEDMPPLLKIDTATPLALKTKTLGLLHDNKIVIWGWCHSIMSLRTCERGTMWKFQSDMPQHSDNLAWKQYWDSQSIAQVINSDFHWV